MRAVLAPQIQNSKTPISITNFIGNNNIIIIYRIIPIHLNLKEKLNKYATS